MSKKLDIKPLNSKRGECDLFEELIHSIEWGYTARALVLIGEILRVSPDLLEKKDSEGRTPLIWAVAHGRESVARVLIENMSPQALSVITPSDGETALTWAVDSGMTKICELLLTRIGS